MTRKLYRSRTDRMIWGILGGLGNYFSVDPVIFRLIYVLLVIATGIMPGVLLYIVAVFVIPLDPIVTVVADDAPSA